jgi:hypothetical protein
MSLDQHTDGGRHVIDLTRGPVIDLTRAAYYSADRAELEEAANRLLLSQLGQAAPATFPATTGPIVYWPEHMKPARRHRAGAHINLMTVLTVSIVAAFAIMLIGLVSSAQY